MRNAIFYGLVGGVFAAFGLWQLKGFLLYAAAANYFEGRKYK
jgi:hypothetical protein